MLVYRKAEVLYSIHIFVSWLDSDYLYGHSKMGSLFGIDYSFNTGFQDLLLGLKNYFHLRTHHLLLVDWNSCLELMVFLNSFDIDCKVYSNQEFRCYFLQELDLKLQISYHQSWLSHSFGFVKVTCFSIKSIAANVKHLKLSYRKSLLLHLLLVKKTIIAFGMIDFHYCVHLPWQVLQVTHHPISMIFGLGLE